MPVPTALPKPRCHCLTSLSEPARKVALEACSWQLLVSCFFRLLLSLGLPVLSRFLFLAGRSLQTSCFVLLSLASFAATAPFFLLPSSCLSLLNSCFLILASNFLFRASFACFCRWDCPSFLASFFVLLALHLASCFLRLLLSLELPLLSRFLFLACRSFSLAS